jgi:hypothetical protein
MSSPDSDKLVIVWYVSFEGTQINEYGLPWSKYGLAQGVPFIGFA